MTVSDAADGASKVVKVIVGMPSIDPILDSCMVGCLLLALLVSEIARFLTPRHEKHWNSFRHHIVKSVEEKVPVVQSGSLLKPRLPHHVGR
jgi:hypothetical protein